MQNVGNIVPCVFTPILAKHSKNFSLQDSLSVGVDRMQRFEPRRCQVARWRDQQLTDAAAKLIIYRAFIESDLDVPKHLAPRVHDLYFNPKYAEFEPRALWSLPNAFTCYAVAGGTRVLRNSCARRKPRLYCSVKLLPR